jgi:hypothetical protein
MARAVVVARTVDTRCAVRALLATVGHVHRPRSILRHAEEVSGSFAATCRCYGISRNVFYTWKRRNDGGGLDALRDRSSAPHRTPNATSTEVVGKIIHFQECENYYNYQRPRGALGGQTPHERLKQNTKAQTVTDGRQLHNENERQSLMVSVSWSPRRGRATGGLGAGVRHPTAGIG